MAKIDRVQEVSTELLKPYGNNAKIHGKDQVEKIAESIKSFGFLNPCLIDKDFNVIAGHGRLLAAQSLGMKEIPCIYIEGLTEAERKAYILADNRLGELSEWDDILLNTELAELASMNIDVDLTGFDFDADHAWFDTHERDDTSYQEGNEEYNEWLDKFEDKKTTDDCYTPDIIYEAIADWVASEYKLDRNRFVRPFYPGGDYESENYVPGCVVVDNPPFSILAEIVRFYTERKIKFFLFAPALMLFNASSSYSSSCAICTGNAITYENGASIPTSFVTNLEDGLRFRTAPGLYAAIKEANKEYTKNLHADLPKYSYPDYVATAACINILSKYGVDFSVGLSESYRISSLESQKAEGKTIFGSGYLISEKAAAEKAAAEKAAAIRWEISEAEWEIIRGLG